MKAFDYAEPRSEVEVLELLADKPGKTEILAGGTDLVGLMKDMVVTPDLVVNIMSIESLRQMEWCPDGSLSIGATVTLDELLETHYLSDYRGVTDAILGINSMQLRARGTIGGEICQRPQCWHFRRGRGLLPDLPDGSDMQLAAIFGNGGPARFVSSSRLAPALIALGAFVRILGPREDQDQVIPLEAYFRTPRQPAHRETILLPNQLLTHILLPPAGGRRSATYEVRQSAGPDFPLASAAAMLHIDGGLVEDARIVLGQVAPIPWVSPEAADCLLGNPVTAAVAEAAGAAAVACATPFPDNGYKIQLAQVAVKRAVLRAAGIDIGAI
ncbi:MAG: molybdopterin dehydrogenase [Planctomycetes bacterium]|nr:molybdopterin dehydrogenase [Planctomycetota bacterium]